MEPVRDLAVVLRVVPYEDRHKIVTALTENHGRVTLVARNAVQSRRFGPGLENFAAGDWMFTHKPGAEIGGLSDLNLRRAFSEIPKEFERLALAGFFSEIILRVTQPWEPCTDVFRLHSNALAILDEGLAAEKLSFLANVYLGKILIWYGTQPHWARCESCDKKLEDFPPDTVLHGVLETMGWICPGCDPKTHSDQAVFKFTIEALICVWDALAQPLKRGVAEGVPNPKTQAPLFQWMTRLLAFHVPGFDQLNLKTLRFLGF
jgi:DNA repair protein RecO